LGGSGVNVDALAQESFASGQPSDVSAAVGPRYFVEAVNSRLAAYTRTGTERCTVALAALFGAEATDLSGPRVQYDAVHDRYSLVAMAPATTAQEPARLYLATTRGANPCATWWVYVVTLQGTLFPSGGWLDHPYLGQDPQSLLLSANVFRDSAYVGSMALALPKAAVYGGVVFDVPAFPVGFSTAPVTTTVIGDDSYYMAAVPHVGYRIYRMVNSAGPGTVLLDEGTIASPFAAPSRRARQCTGATLDPLDGRITSPPVRIGDYLWFTHGFDSGGRPGIRYGAIGVFTHSVYLGRVAHSSTSDDFNPSIGVSDAGYGLNYVWLNWVFTDTGARPCVDVTAVVDGVDPGEGIPDLLGTGTILVHGGATDTDAPFGRYSSVSVDQWGRRSCPTGAAAVMAQQYFGTDGRWRTRIGRLESC
jgi:hypothetical protein